MSNYANLNKSALWFKKLQKKWHEVPAGILRISTEELLKLSDKKLLKFWTEHRDNAITGTNFNVRGWYHQLYADVLGGKKVMDFGSGFGIDGITFAQNGADITFVDIVESNLEILKKICALLNLGNVHFQYIEDISSISELPNDYDVIWAQGSLINAPFEVIRQEIQVLLEHLPVGGRWIELAYPKCRWEKEGQMPFDKWGSKTDGGAPWIEWYDMKKLKSAMEPVQFDVVLYLEFCNGDFNWFDLIRRL